MNIIEFLEENDIRIWYEGKNVSDGYIGIRCRFCEDSSNHMGIRVKDLKVTCWKCGQHSLADLVKEILECNDKQAYRIARSIERDEDIKPTAHIEYSDSESLKNILPTNTRDIFPRVHLQYLRSRGFNARKIIRKYNLKAVYHSGKYKYRIIIPCYMEGRLVSFTSRDITDSQDPKYLAASKRETNFPPDRCVYNLDSVPQGGNAMLLEGPFDVFRMGDGAFCFFGIQCTGMRILEVKKKKINKLYIFYDAETRAQRQARHVARALAPVVRHVEIVNIRNSLLREKKADPGSLSNEQAMRIKRWLELGR